MRYLKQNAEFLRRMVEQLYTPDRKQEILDNSYYGYHANGVKYVCLSRSKGLTIKLYEFAPHELNELGYLVWPHNHGYTFEQYLLRGSVTHHVFTTADTEPERPTIDHYLERRHPKVEEWCRHRFYSARKENKTLPEAFLDAAKQKDRKVNRTEYKDRVLLTRESTMMDEPGDGYILEPDDIHTLTPSVVAPSYVLSFQYPSTDSPTNIYAPETLPRDLDAPYRPLSGDDADRIVSIATTDNYSV